MYNLLIVDDEKVVLDVLESIVDWEEYGIDKVETAGDGIDALEHIKKSPPDIVLTDIRMPGLNGLELVEQSKLYAESTMFIIISGYSEFEYAKRAIELETVDYLVKPIEIEDIKKALSKAIDKHSKKKEAKEANEQIKKYKGEIEEKYLIDSMLGGIIDRRLIEQAFKAYKVAVIGFKNISLKTLLDGQEKHYLSLLKNPFENKGYTLMLNVIDGNIVLFYGNSKSHHVDEKIIEALTNKVQEEFCNVIITGVSTIHNDIIRIDTAYNEAKQAFKIAYFFNQTYTHYEEHKQVKQKIGQDIIDKIDEFLRQSHLELSDVYLLCDDILNYIKMNSLSPEKSRYLSYKFINRLYEYMNSEYDVKLLKIIDDDHLLYEKLSRLESIEAIEEWLHIQIQQLHTFIKNNSVTYNDNLLINVKTFINEHYNELIELNKLAEKFHINSAYLSSLFSKTMGVTIFDYITSLRMKKAKKLLRSSNYKINEICQQVGYENSRYFNQVFKKKVGTTPGKYRAKHIIRVREED